MATLVLGGARAGKTRYALMRAEALAAATGRRLIMIATAEAFDDEMRARIRRHQDERSAAWTTREAPHDLATALSDLTSDKIAVVDCLTLWLSNAMAAGRDVEAQIAALCDAVVACPCPLLLVSNEVGWGIVPDNALARAFRDHAGRLHQRLAAQVDEAVLIVAGLPLTIKSST